MNYLDLFSGIGGFSLGLKEAGVEIDKHFYSEIDKYAEQVYRKQFPEAVGIGSITDCKVFTEGNKTTITNESFRYCFEGKIDLITFGFPCQDLSIAGKRKGIGGARSGLFFEAMRIVRATRPRYFIFENVKGLFSSNNGEDWLAVLREVAESGYDGQWQLLNTRWFLPQNRERIYFVGHIRGECRPKVFPIEINGGMVLDKGAGLSSVRQVAGSLRATDYKGTHNLVRENRDIVIPVQTPNRKNKRGNGRWIKNENEASFTLGVQDKHGILINGKIRHFTPLEHERLHGFPDGWTEGLSDTQRYKCLGNAVSVPVVKAVMERLYAKN